MRKILRELGFQVFILLLASVVLGADCKDMGLFGANATEGKNKIKRFLGSDFNDLKFRIVTKSGDTFIPSKDYLVLSDAILSVPKNMNFQSGKTMWGVDLSNTEKVVIVSEAADGVISASELTFIVMLRNNGVDLETKQRLFDEVRESGRGVKLEGRPTSRSWFFRFNSGAAYYRTLAMIRSFPREVVQSVGFLTAH